VNLLNYWKPHFWWLWLSFVFVVSVIPSQQTSSSGWISQLHIDKVFHLFSHAIAIFLIGIALKSSKVNLANNIKYTFIVVFMFLFGFFIEWFQGNYILGRMFDVMDIVANTAGDFLGLFFLLYFLKSLKP